MVLFLVPVELRRCVDAVGITPKRVGVRRNANGLFLNTAARQRSPKSGRQNAKSIRSSAWRETRARRRAGQVRGKTAECVGAPSWLYLITPGAMPVNNTRSLFSTGCFDLDQALCIRTGNPVVLRVFRLPTSYPCRVFD
jgi:hypothetical protein